MMANITFLSFLLFSMCHSIYVAVNTWLNCSFFTLMSSKIREFCYFSGIFSCKIRAFLIFFPTYIFGQTVFPPSWLSSYTYASSSKVRGEGIFILSGPSAWNALPADIRDETSTAAFFYKKPEKILLLPGVRLRLTNFITFSSFQEWANAMARRPSSVRPPSVCLSVNFCANRFFSQTHGRIATKLAQDGLQVSLHPECAQGQGQSQRSRDTRTFLHSWNELLRHWQSG